MARIADEVIERVKRDISLVRLVENWGLPLKKHGKDYIGHCPFHDDKTPSFVVSPDSSYDSFWCMTEREDGCTPVD